jgi:putative membrane protein
MINKILLASILLCGTVTLPALAQDPTAMTGSLTSTDVGVSPIAGQSASDYVKAAADGDNYEIQSSRVALSRSKNANVKSFARQMIADHSQTSQSLMAALSNADRTITKPSTALSASNTAKVQLLKKAPKASFDTLYMQQQMQSHQTAWAVHKGYVVDGADPALKQVASTALPVVERHITSLKGSMPAGM